jgi:DNA (cytosine-5)-methyltransferase 1
MRLLDTFCGAGGCSMGYHRAGFEVVGVDIAPQPRFPFDFVQADAIEYIQAHGHEFDVIHASPPCQKHVTLQYLNRAQGRENEHIDLIPATRAALRATGKPYIIENVQGSTVETMIILCGHSLGLKRLARHRHFESNYLLFAPPCSHRRSRLPIIGVYGDRPDGHRVSERQYRLTRTASSLAEASGIMGIDWMEWHELKEAIPPAYTEWIGTQLLAMLEG